MSKKRLSAVLLFLIIIALPAACAAPTAQPAAAPAAPVIQTVVVEKEKIVEKPVVETVIVEKAVTAAPEAKKTNLTVWVFGSEDQKAPNGVPWGQWYRENLVKPFMEANPDINVDFAMKGLEAGGTTLFIDTAVAAGQPPDIYNDAMFRMGKFGQANQLLPMNPILTPEKRKTIDKDALASVTKNGITWALLTQNTLPDALIVNRALFKAKGLENLLPKEPNRDWTTEEFQKACEAINAPPNLYCTIFFAKTPSYDHAMFAWLTPYGCQRFTPGDYTKVTDDTPGCIEAHKWIKSMIDKGLAVPGPAGLVDDNEDAYLLGGQVAIGSGGWYEKDLVSAGKADKSLKIDWDPYMVNYPSLPGQKPGPLANLGGQGWSAFKTGDHEKEAAALKFIDYATSWDILNKYFQVAGGGQAGIPLIRPENFDPATLYGNDKDAIWIMNMLKERGAVDLGYGAPNFNELRAKWAEMRQAAWSGDMSVEDATKAWVAQANAILNRK